MQTIFDHLRECAANGDMPTLDAEDAQRIVETVDNLVAAMREALHLLVSDDTAPDYADRYFKGVQQIDVALEDAITPRPSNWL